MDVDGFGKGGKKGGKGQNWSQNPNPNKDVVCRQCGKQGHLSTEGGSNPKSQSCPGGGQHKGGEGKPKNGGLEQRPQPALANSLDVASFEKRSRSPHLHPEGWLRWTCDPCAEISACPLDAKIGTETEENACI